MRYKGFVSSCIKNEVKYYNSSNLGVLFDYVKEMEFSVTGDD